jgi:hypothetical protein
MLETTRYRIVLKLPLNYPLLDSPLLQSPSRSLAHHCLGSLMMCNNTLCPNSGGPDVLCFAVREGYQAADKGEWPARCLPTCINTGSKDEKYSGY